jgi:hypothetical protein
MPQFMNESYDAISGNNIKNDVEKQEIFNRADSGIDINQLDSTYFTNTRLNIAAGLFTRPLNGPEMILQKEKLRYPETDDIHKKKAVYEMEKKLLEFQESKQVHKNNLERLVILKNDVDTILINRKCPSFMLKDKIREIESLGKEISDYKENIEKRKSELDRISQNLLLLIQKTR